ncbi:hypothetical protein [Streptomyces sp. bgisy029]|uniref:hypothetical protein n=1 Tax=Streptomyces sp. bgisy029 TaxID=3413771 RepID=UPI003D728795
MTAFDRLTARVRALPPLAAALLVVVGLFTATDLAVNDPGYRQADALSWACSRSRSRRWPCAAAGPFRWCA